VAQEPEEWVTFKQIELESRNIQIPVGMTQRIELVERAARSKNTLFCVLLPDIPLAAGSCTLPLAFCADFKSSFTENRSL
jgi:hypothetical protein